MSTKPCPPPTALPEDNFPTHAPASRRSGRITITPLARAALENGVCFDDVKAYLDSNPPGSSR